ncbi:MAG TPA: hypothetical protein VGW38_23450 [Chloroflexota bacterium]|nr:hypothetical protein [Chloroflexota bacterium]
MNDTPACLVLLLGGPSGIGKTTIAAQIPRYASLGRGGRVGTLKHRTGGA